MIDHDVQLVAANQTLSISECARYTRTGKTRERELEDVAAAAWMASVHFHLIIAYLYFAFI